MGEWISSYTADEWTEPRKQTLTFQNSSSAAGWNQCGNNTGNKQLDEILAWKSHPQILSGLLKGFSFWQKCGGAFVGVCQLGKLPTVKRFNCASRVRLLLMQYSFDGALMLETSTLKSLQGDKIYLSTLLINWGLLVYLWTELSIIYMWLGIEWALWMNIYPQGVISSRPT